MLQNKGGHVTQQSSSPADTQRAKSFLAALQQGSVGLHPTDTVPGLTCWPSLGLDKLTQFKHRPENRPFLFLAATAGQAFRLWQPLPLPWQEALTQLWPGALTVVFSSSEAGQQLQAGSTLAVRVPRLASQDEWFRQVLRSQPLPSTSVNLSGAAHARTWAEALASVAGRSDVHAPCLNDQNNKESELSSTSSPAPSTLITITGERSFTVLREGAIVRSTIESAL